MNAEISTPDAIQLVAAAIFAVGVFGVLSRRNLLIMLCLLYTSDAADE